MKYFDKYLADFDKIYIYLRVFRVKEFEFGVIFVIGSTRKHQKLKILLYPSAQIYKYFDKKI